MLTADSDFMVATIDCRSSVVAIRLASVSSVSTCGLAFVVGGERPAGGRQERLAVV